MVASKSKSFSGIVVQTLGWPLFWGLCGTLGFYLLVHSGVIGTPMVRRYFAGHPVEYLETVLFFIGVAALWQRAADLTQQFRQQADAQLPSADEGGDRIERISSLLCYLAELPSKIRETYLARRLRDALEHAQRLGTTDQLNEQLKHLSDLEVERAHEAYSLVRIVVWATPMLGFLGTVIGITMALGGLSPEALVDEPKEAMKGLLSGLGVAFDTTALALSLSMILMFVQFLVRQVESQLLTLVDLAAAQQLEGRFQQLGTQNDPHLASVARMAQVVIESVAELVQNHAEVWQSTMRDSQSAWAESLREVRGTIQSGFQSAIESSTSAHAAALLEIEQAAHVQSAAQWDGMRQVLSENAHALAAQQVEISKQNELMLRVLEATGDVIKLEDVLNDNLTALSTAKNFEDTVMSLSAAIHLLNTRLGGTPARPVKVTRATAPSQEERAA